MADWRDALLHRFSYPGYERLGRNPLAWPGYTPREAVRYGIGEIGGHKVVACVWDFAAYGGSLGEQDATTFVEACEAAATYGEPLVSFVRSGGVRLQEGVAALVGMPRAQLALTRLADAGVPHIAVADAPTTGGVFISIVTRADYRIAVGDATIGFAGPRVAEAVLGRQLHPGSHTAESAYEHGLVDALVDGDDVPAALPRILAAFTATAEPGELGDAVDLRAEEGDPTVRAFIGPASIGVAVAAAPGLRPTPAGYRLVQRAARLASRLGRPLVTYIDMPGAAPDEDAEAHGIGAAIADTMDAVLSCRAPTVAVLTGDGGGGGALAVSVCDRVFVTPGSHFAALPPDASAATLRTAPGAAAERVRLGVTDLLALGFADAAIPQPPGPAFTSSVAGAVAELAAEDPETRLAARRARWSAPLPGHLT